VFGGLNRLLVVAAVGGMAAAVMLAAPAASLACSGSTSAVNVYHECLPSGGGGNPTTGGNSRGGSDSGSGALSGQAAKAVKHAGTEGRTLAAVERTRTGRLQSNPSSSMTAEPSAVGSAFDLGSGPGAFLIALAGGALLLIGGSGLRVWHRRRP
jgi:hypothetical protein